MRRDQIVAATFYVADRKIGAVHGPYPHYSSAPSSC